jgi:hypothetical protein
MMQMVTQHYQIGQKLTLHEEFGLVVVVQDQFGQNIVPAEDAWGGWAGHVGLEGDEELATEGFTAGPVGSADPAAVDVAREGAAAEDKL